MRSPARRPAWFVPLSWAPSSTPRLSAISGSRPGIAGAPARTASRAAARPSADQTISAIRIASGSPDRSALSSE